MSHLRQPCLVTWVEVDSKVVLMKVPVNSGKLGGGAEAGTVVNMVITCVGEGNMGIPGVMGEGAIVGSTLDPRVV